MVIGLAGGIHSAVVVFRNRTGQQIWQSKEVSCKELEPHLSCVGHFFFNLKIALQKLHMLLIKNNKINKTPFLPVSLPQDNL